MPPTPKPNQDKQIEVLLTQILSAVQKTALEVKILTPYAELLIGDGATKLTIPERVKAFNIINLGENGDSEVFLDIPVTGITGLAAVPKGLKVFGYSIENDQNVIAGPVEVTPPNLHHVLIQYLL